MSKTSNRKRKIESDSGRGEKSDDEINPSGTNNDIPENKTKGDGFADTILNLLKQDTGLKIPVLSGRNTSLMKQLRTHQIEERDVQKKKLEKRRKIEGKMILPQENNIEMERQLRKLATKGVVALFNAVAKAKKEIAEASEKSASKEAKNGEVRLSLANKPNCSAEKSQLKQSTNSLQKWGVVNENSTEDLLLVSNFFKSLLFLEVNISLFRIGIRTSPFSFSIVFILLLVYNVSL